MPKYPLCWSGRQGVREKYFTAKGVRSPKSLGTAALQEFEMRILSKVVTFFRDLCILNKNSEEETVNHVLCASVC